MTLSPLEIVLAGGLLVSLALNVLLYFLCRRFLDARDELEAIIRASGTVADVSAAQRGPARVRQSK